MLTERQSKMLKLIVERYIKDPTPVGSKVISKTLNCSSATIRNEMAALEDLGLVRPDSTAIKRSALIWFCFA